MHSFTSCKNLKNSLLIIVLITLLLSACHPGITAVESGVLPVSSRAPQPVDKNATISMFFTDPAVKGKAAPGWAIIDGIVADIDSAAESVDVAMYNFSLRPVSDALVNAAKRGVAVRMVVDSDALDGSELQRLKKAGIQILGDRRESLMHNKFVIIDSVILWTGSLNLTSNGTSDDENVMARFQSPDLAANYSAKFNEMFKEDRFGPDSRQKTYVTRFSISGMPVENYFSPEDAIDTRLVSLIGSAKKSVHVLAYSFTLNRLADALIKADKNGVEVRGVFDEESAASNQGADFTKLKDAGLDVHLDSDPGLMHIKAILVDGEIVEFGSYNFTASAENRNDENIVIVKDPTLEASFEQNFERIYQKAKP